MEYLDEIKNILEKFNEFYWNSEMVNDISLIDDLRLSRNIHETAHSRILYRLLLAHTPGESFSFLKCFLESVGLGNLLDYNGKVEVHVEYENIDVLITDGKKCIIIENKVNHACDQNRQLVRYIDNFKDFDVYILYLVRNVNGSGPSAKSLPDIKREELINKGKFKLISYQKQIREWLQSCKSKVESQKIESKNELLHSILVQYLHFLDGMFQNNLAMNKEDAAKFKSKVLEVDPKGDPISDLEKIRKIKRDIVSFQNTMAEYEKFLKNDYLLDFKKQTGISKARLNAEGKIDFAVTILGVDVLFVYDFLNVGKADFIWFGTENEIRLYSPKEQSPKVAMDPCLKRNIQKMLRNVPNGYSLKKGDNYDPSKEDVFHIFNEEFGWIYLYCKDNKSAIFEIKKYVELLGT